MNADSAKRKRSPLTNFSFFYLIVGIGAIGVYYFAIDRDTAQRLALSWLAIAVPLAMIVWGRALRDRSEFAALMYLTGLALLPVLLIVGILIALNADQVMTKMHSLF